MYQTIVTYVYLFYFFFSFSSGCSDGSDFSAAEKRVRSAQTPPSGDAKKGVPEPDSDVKFTFTNSKVEDAEAVIEGTVLENSIDFTLEMETQGVLDKALQTIRDPRIDRFQQGSPAITKREEFNADSKSGSVDIVVVVDDSRSMRQEQDKLAPNLSALLSKINNASWQVAITSTSPKKDICYRKLIKKTDNPNINILTQSFANTVANMGIKGAVSEQGLFMAKRAVSCGQWLQPGSSIAVLVVSDEDNCSRGCTSQAAGRPPLLKSYLDSIRPADKTRVFAIIKESNACSGALRIGNQYKQSVNLNGGETGNICANDYSPILQSISEVISETIDDSFIISQQPIVSSVKVQINQVYTNNFTLQGKTISLGAAPPKNSKILITYDTTNSSVKNTFTLSQPPAPGTLKVEVNAIPIAANEYTVAGNNLVFFNAPPAAAQIVADYRSNLQTLRTSFPLSKKPADSAKVVVRVDGSVVNNIAVDTVDQKVRFPSPPSDGAALSFTYTANIGPRLLYKVFKGSINDTIIGVTPKDAPNQYLANVSVSKSGIVRLKDVTDFSEGRILQVHIRKASGSSPYTLAYQPIPGSLKILESPCPLRKGLVIARMETLEIDCAFADKPFKISFQYESQQVSAFKLPELPTAESEVIVTINGAATSNFEIVGDELVINEVMTPASTIEYKEIKQ